MKKISWVVLCGLVCFPAFAMSPIETAVLGVVRAQEKMTLQNKQQLPSPQAAVNFVNEKYHLNVTELTQIDPVYLYVYANYLYENGRENDSVFWFYDAQYRGKIIGAMENENSLVPLEQFRQLAEEAGSYMLGQTTVIGRGLNREYWYNFIQSGLGYTINYYAGSNINNWIEQMKKVLAFEEANPFDPFQAVPAEQLDASKLKIARKRADGLKELIRYMEEHKAEIERERAANDEQMEQLKNLK